MLFNQKKCKSMLVTKSGKQTTNQQFFMQSDSGLPQALKSTLSEKDLGIILSNNFKFSEQASHTANKASIALGQLKRAFSVWTPRTFKLLYSTFVRPHLEYIAPAWSPHLTKDISIIEKVPRRSTKLVLSLKKLSYKQILDALQLTTLKTRRLRGDLIQYFKFDRNIKTWRRSNPLVHPLSQCLRRQSHRVRRQFVKNCKQRDNFFLNRIFPFWNYLPESVIQSISVNQFKNPLDKHIKDNNGLNAGMLLLSGLSF